MKEQDIRPYMRVEIQKDHEGEWVKKGDRGTIADPESINPSTGEKSTAHLIYLDNSDARNAGVFMHGYLIPVSFDPADVEPVK